MLEVLDYSRLNEDVDEKPFKSMFDSPFIFSAYDSDAKLPLFLGNIDEPTP